MPQTEPYRAWATFSFSAMSGRINECDLFIAVPRGLYLVELKGHPGRLVNNGSTWSFQGPDKVRTISNPLHLTNLKSKEFKGQLEAAARELYPGRKLRIPRIEPAVFLSDPGLVSELDEVQRNRVYGRDGSVSGLPCIWEDLLGTPPQREEHRLTADFTQRLPDLLHKISITASTSHLNLGEWRLEPHPLDAGDTWEDRLAKREGLVHEEGRVRVYLVELQASDDARRSTERAAMREYQVLQGITHPGIAQAVDLRDHQGGPAILFRHQYDDLRLDDYLAVHGAKLSDETRRGMVRQLADALRYAHRRDLYHRALAARSVYVTAKADGSKPVLRIIDWQSAARDFDTTSLRSLGNSPLGEEHIQDAAEAYLAPGFDEEYADPVELDVFGLGAVAYLILTGTAPAARRSELMARLASDGGLHPYAVSDSIAASLDELVYQATRSEVTYRLESVDAFLKQLDGAEQDVNSQAASAEADPLTATPGQALDAEWTVVRVLGTGATARALLVQRVADDGDFDAHEAGRTRVLKVALGAEKDARLMAEAKALRQVGGGRIVRLFDGPRQLGNRTVLDLEYAGEQSLAQRLRGQGRLSYGDLESFGEDLFKALYELATKKIRHRDIKPDNLGVGLDIDGHEHLMLFDFSLADVSDLDLKAGTRGYLDPFLDQGHRKEYDDQAEYYAAAVTLHEMASGERPVWGDGLGDPRTTRDETPALAEDLFEQGLREGLTAFFTRALHRDSERRYDSLKQMGAAWRELFSHADLVPPATTPATAAASAATEPGDRGDTDALQRIRDTAAEAAGLSTQLVAAGLSPRAVSVASDFRAHTVSELLGVPLHQLAKARGAGVLTRRELTKRHKAWTAALGGKAVRAGRTAKAAVPAAASATATEVVVLGQLAARGSVDQLAALLTPGPTRANSNKSEVIRAALGLPGEDSGHWQGKLAPWPTQISIAKALGTQQGTVSRHMVSAIKEWAETAWLQQIRDELVAILDAAGRVMTAQELAVELRVRHGAGDEDPVLTRAKALAVVRAAAEAEALPDGRDEEHQPRLAVLRRGERVLVALESLAGSDAPSAPDLADYAALLAVKADELAVAEPLPGRASVVRDLRAVRMPEGMVLLAETRLVALAAAGAANAYASPRLELYPRNLSLARALRISQAPAGIRRDLGISVDDLLAKVRYRFPELDFGTPTHVAVEVALRSSDFPLEFDTTEQLFRPPTPSVNGTRLASGTATGTVTAGGRAALGAAAAGRDPEALLTAKLRTASERGGFVALNVHVKYLSGAADAVAGAFPVLPVNLAQVFLTEFRAVASDHGREWSAVLNADTGFTRSGELSGGLRSYVTRVWPRVADRLAETAATREQSVLFLHSAGLVGRFWDAGGREALATLQNSARRGGDTPQGLWLLCPSESPSGASHLDGHTVEVLGAAERAVLGRSFLASLRTGAAELVPG